MAVVALWRKGTPLCSLLLMSTVLCGLFVLHPVKSQCTSAGSSHLDSPNPYDLEGNVIPGMEEIARKLEAPLRAGASSVGGGSESAHGKGTQEQGGCAQPSSDEEPMDEASSSRTASSHMHSHARLNSRKRAAPAVAEEGENSFGGSDNWDEWERKMQGLADGGEEDESIFVTYAKKGSLLILLLLVSMFFMSFLSKSQEVARANLAENSTEEEKKSTSKSSAAKSNAKTGKAKKKEAESKTKKGGKKMVEKKGKKDGNQKSKETKEGKKKPEDEDTDDWEHVEKSNSTKKKD